MTPRHGGRNWRAGATATLYALVGAGHLLVAWAAVGDADSVRVFGLLWFLLAGVRLWRGGRPDLSREQRATVYGGGAVLVLTAYLV